MKRFTGFDEGACVSLCILAHHVRYVIFAKYDCTHVQTVYIYLITLFIYDTYIHMVVSIKRGTP